MQRGNSGETSLEQFVEALGDACLILSVDLEILASNAAAAQLYGVDSDDLRGREFGSLFIADQDLSRLVELAAIGGSPCRFSAAQRGSRGVGFSADIVVSRFPDVEPGHLVVVARKRPGLDYCDDELELRDLLLEEACDGILAHTVDGTLLYANSAAIKHWGISAEEVRSRGAWGWVSEEQRARIPERMARLAAAGESQFESHGRRPDGRTGHVEIHSRLVQTSNGPVVMSIVHDISERMQTEEVVRYLAYHDMLTGLANRALLTQELAHAAAAADRHGDTLGVAFVDVDGFKPVNDTFGHTAGDHVLRELSHRISSCVRETDIVARLGGDEFVVVLPRLSHPSDIEEVARKIIAAVRTPIPVADTAISISVSVGLALHEHGESPETLLARADLAMYAARKSGMDNWRLLPAR